METKPDQLHEASMHVQGATHEFAWGGSYAVAGRPALSLSGGGGRGISSPGSRRPPALPTAGDSLRRLVGDGSRRPDGGIYVMLYSDNWIGKFMREFSKEIVPKYRMLKSYDILYSMQNVVPPESFEKRKKRCFCKKNVDPDLKSDVILALAAVAAEEGANSTQGTVAGDKNH
ncbi:uncharacterized protein LOC124663327 [Lolium rigidum]|uniref:uncharacterized protein LOC124663327 n=1 Tax=Lolium rigidum TaxID=89674 RepID=UPI001F5CBA7F|nr:uncharacterized protein LOC124663327 [Lolium rigidum]